MRIYNPTYKKIAINWDSVELPVNEGTPFAADGTIANTSDAIGLLPVYIWKKPIDEEVYILIGGDVYQSEVEAAFGAELTDDAIASMGGINFYENDGTIDKESGGGGGGSTDVEFINFVAVPNAQTQEVELTANKTPSEVVAGIQAHKIYMSNCMIVYAENNIYTVAAIGVPYVGGVVPIQFEDVMITGDPSTDEWTTSIN